MKRLLILLLLLVLLPSAAFAAISVFSDVEKGSYYEEAVFEAWDKGLMRGYKNTNLFGPGDNLNRADMAVILSRYDTHVMNALRYQYGIELKYICPEDNPIYPSGSNEINCAHENYLGSPCMSQKYQLWAYENCVGFAVLE